MDATRSLLHRALRMLIKGFAILVIGISLNTFAIPLAASQPAKPPQRGCRVGGPGKDSAFDTPSPWLVEALLALPRSARGPRRAFSSALGWARRDRYTALGSALKRVQNSRNEPYSGPSPADRSFRQNAPPEDASATKPKNQTEEKDGQQTPKVAPPPDRFVWRQRPSFRFGNVFRLDFSALLHEDVHRSYEGAEALAGLTGSELRRARVGIQGNLFRRIEYEIERALTEKDLAPDQLAAGLRPQSPWRDVRVDVDFVTALQVQVGRFKIPFGLDRLTGISNTDFVYRSLAAEYLAPGRDTGVMVHGRFFRRGLNYWTGVFKHDGDNARSKKIRGADRTYAVRVTGRPFRRLEVVPLNGLAVGTAFTISDLSNAGIPPNGLRGRTVMTEDTFFSPVYVSGRRRRLEGELDWLLGPASARAEYTYVTDARLKQGIRNQDLPDARYRSWYVSGSYLLTGERKERPVRPRADLFRGGAGAVELALRYERIRYDSVGGDDIPFSHPRAETILPNGDRILTVGVNWIFNRWLTLQVNGIREYVEDPGRNPAPNGGAFWSRVLRFQVAL